MAGGFGGQLIWVHLPLDLEIATTSTVSTNAQRQAQALELIRGRLFAAAQRRAAGAGR